MDLNTVYLAADNFRELATQQNVLMSRSAWRVLFAADGRATVGDVINQLKISPTKLEIVFDELVAHGLVKEKTMSLEEFEQSMQGNVLADVKTTIIPTAPAAASPVTQDPVATMTNRAFDLKSVSDYIISMGGKGRVGHLAAHRVFLKIPPAILKQAGISSLEEIYKNMIIKDDALKAEIIKSTKSTLKKDIPPEVFAI